MVELDPAFLQAVEHKPKSHSIEAQNIPLIDLSPINLPPDSAVVSELVAEIGGAYRNWGFFHVINHGVPSKCCERILSAFRKFFALPKEEKNKVSRNAENPFGYYDSEHMKNVRDWKEVFDIVVRNLIVFPTSHEPDDMELIELFNKWPHTLPKFQRGRRILVDSNIEIMTFCSQWRS